MQGVLTHGNAAAGTGALEPQPFPGAGKSGSTHDFSDCWFVGYNSRVTCGVWVGFLQGAGTPIYEGAFGRDLAMPAWVAAMNAARPVFGGGPIAPPPELNQLEICRVSGQRATGYCYETVEDPKTGVPTTRPTTFAEWFRRDGPAIPFCAVHGGSEDPLAGPADPDRGASGVVLNAVPIRPRAAVLLGEDPYNSEPVATAGADAAETPAVFPRRTMILDSLDLGDAESELSLPRPRRLEISPD
jgi:penicillin-binding protein 1A